MEQQHGGMMMSQTFGPLTVKHHNVDGWHRVWTEEADGTLSDQWESYNGPDGELAGELYMALCYELDPEAGIQVTISEF